MPTRSSVRKGGKSGRRHSRRGSNKLHQAMSVDALQHIFQRIEDRMSGMIHRGSSDKALSACLARAWNENFHQELSEPAVRGMIIHYRSVNSLPSGPAAGRKTRRRGRATQKGGMAPMSWTMDPGSSAPTYGRFETDYSVTPSVLQSMNRGFESSVSRSCNSVAGHDAPQQGGGIMDAIGMPHFMSSVPQNSLYSAANAIQGGPVVMASSSPISAQPALTHMEPKPFDTTALSQFTTMSSVYPGY